MTTLALDQPRDFFEGDFSDFPIIANDIVFQGAAVGDNGSGYARPLVAGDPFKGFADKQVDNTGGAAGDLDVRCRTRGDIELAISGLAITDEGKDVFASDDNTFTLTSSTNTYIGYVHRWISTGYGVIRFRSAAGVQTALTDSTGATADTTLADGLTAVAVTDNSGGVDAGDNIIAVVTNLDTLTDSTSGTADNTVNDVSTAVTGVDGSGSNAASKADVDTRLTAINKNFKELVDQVITQKAANTALLAAVAQLAAKYNVVVTDLTSQNNNDSDLAAAINLIIRRLGN